MSDRNTRKELLIALLQNADNFPSLVEEGHYVPMSFQTAIICAHIAAGWVETGEVPTDEDWDAHEPAPEVMATPETTSKH